MLLFLLFIILSAIKLIEMFKPPKATSDDDDKNSNIIISESNRKP